MKIYRRISRVIALLLTFFTFVSVTIPLSYMQASAVAPVVFDTEPVPVNPNANQTCKNLYQYLCNVGKSDKVICGATSYNLLGVDTEKCSAETDYHQMIKDMFGVTPMIMSTSKNYVYEHDDKDIEAFAKRYSEGAIPMFQASPMIKKVENAIIDCDATNPDRDIEQYNQYVDFLKNLGDFCCELEDAGIEVYFVRLFLENNNTSHQGLYGTTEEGYEAFKRVWRQTIDYLVKEHGVTGALFVYCPAGVFTEPSINYYPGSDYVDINGPTVYANVSDGEIYVEKCCQDYRWMREINRPFAMTELGARHHASWQTVYPTGDYKETIDSVLYAFPETSMVVLWYNDTLSIEPPGDSSFIGNYNGDMLIYHPDIIVAENALDYRSDTAIESVGIATFYKDVDAKQRYKSLNLGKYDVKQLKNTDIALEKITSLDVISGYAVAIYESSDCSGKANVFFGKTGDISTIMKKARSLSVCKLDNLSLEKGIWADNQDDFVFRVNDGKFDRFITEATNDDASLDITIDLGAEYTVGQASIDHAGLYENFTYNIRDFEIYTSVDNSTYKKVYKTVGNTAPQTNVYFNASTARYVRLRITKGNSSKSAYEKARISLAEFTVYGSNELDISSEQTNESISNSLSPLPGGYADNDNVITPDSDGINDIEQNDDPKGELPKIIIPKIYNYVWIIFCGGILLLVGVVWVVIILAYKKKKTLQ